MVDFSLVLLWFWCSGEGWAEGREVRWWGGPNNGSLCKDIERWKKWWTHEMIVACNYYSLYKYWASVSKSLKEAFQSMGNMVPCMCSQYAWMTGSSLCMALLPCRKGWPLSLTRIILWFPKTLSWTISNHNFHWGHVAEHSQCWILHGTGTTIRAFHALPQLILPQMLWCYHYYCYYHHPHFLGEDTEAQNA